MPVIQVRFKLEKETKGALRYQEVDEKGEAIERAWAKIGTLYMRKRARGSPPEFGWLAPTWPAANDFPPHGLVPP
jgi:hypothetical protein